MKDITMARITWLIALFGVLVACHGKDPQLKNWVGLEKAGGRGTMSADMELTVSNEDLGCEEISHRVVDLFREATASVVQCAQDSDCVGIAVDAQCWDSCFTRHLAGNEKTRHAVEAQREEVAALCEQFSNKACVVKASGCPGGADDYRCDQGRCIVVSP